MKKLLILLFLTTNCFLFAQKDCEYSTNVNDSLGSYKSTKGYLMHERVFGGNETSLFFSLVNSDGILSLNFQMISKSKDFIRAFCLDKNSKIYFQLENGKIVTLINTDKEDCGSSIRNENNNARILTGYFLFLKEGYDDLKTSPISLMRIKYATDTVDYVIKSELISELSSIKYSPSNYFVENLKCIE